MSQYLVDNRVVERKIQEF